MFEAAWGVTHRFSGARAIDVDTAFDLASLTKLFAATAALRAVDRGLIALDDPLAAIVGEWNSDERRMISLRMLLAHTSGLASGADYRGLFALDVEAELLRRPLVAMPGATVIYSDLGFIALGVVMTRVTGLPLGTAIDALLDGLPREDLGYRPHARRGAAIPATEVDAWRGMVQGRVHDEKASLMGGVSAHAGLFGTARDVAALCEAYLGPLHGRASALLRSQTIRMAIADAAIDALDRDQNA